MGEFQAKNLNDGNDDHGYEGPTSQRRAKVLTLKDARMRAEVYDGDRGNWLQMLSMIIGHDIGEIAVGDLCRSNSALPQSSVSLHKRKEAYAAKSRAAKQQLASFFEHKVLRHFRELDLEEINRAKNSNGVPTNVCWDNGSVNY